MARCCPSLIETSRIWTISLEARVISVSFWNMKKMSHQPHIAHWSNLLNKASIILAMSAGTQVVIVFRWKHKNLRGELCIAHCNHFLNELSKIWALSLRGKIVMICWWSLKFKPRASQGTLLWSFYIKDQEYELRTLSNEPHILGQTPTKKQVDQNIDKPTCLLISTPLATKNTNGTQRRVALGSSMRAPSQGSKT